jgi:DNA-binding transcriptional ArsR family regulator
MPRAPTTSDAFNAIAEPRRRRIVELLSRGDPRPQSVGELVAALDLPQPTVSKHLAVLREVGLVTVEREGRNRMYRLNPRELQPVHEWISMFERLWVHQTDRIRASAERKAKARLLDCPPSQAPSPE